MHEIARSNGTVRLTLPEHIGTVADVDLRPLGDEAPRSRGTSDEDAGAAGERLSEEMRAIVEALTDGRSRGAAAGDVPEVADAFVIELGDAPAPASERTRGRAASDADAPVTVEVDVADDEAAVMLLESDGSYEWVFPGSDGADDGSSRPRTRGRSGGGTTLVFEISPGGAERVSTETPRTRGLIDAAVGLKNRIAGVVLKFVARKAVGALTRKLERGVEPGLVKIGSATSIDHWVPLENVDTLALPEDRPARVLLLVHGTFSSTLGSFGALTAHAAGQTLLREAMEHYDAVLGYDHHTLSAAPEENARLILEPLRALGRRGSGLRVDAISFSRGGLVFRCLAERVIGASAEDADIAFGRALFVGCTNAGTGLADPENWNDLVDRYTNLVAGASRVLGLSPAARLPMTILRQGIQAIGSLVTYMARKSTLDLEAPGIAAMQPAGEVVRQLNAPPSGGRERAAADVSCTLGARFEPTGVEASSLGRRFVLRLGDSLVDRLMGEANDLVVDTDSMFVVDPLTADGQRLRLELPSDAGVFHTGYFSQPSVAAQLLEWLEIGPSAGGATRGASGSADDVAGSNERAAGGRETA